MSWEKQLGNISRRDRLKERAKESWRSQEGGYNKPPQKSSSGGGDCKIRKCAATKCRHNKDYNCTLAEVDIDTKGMCKMYDAGNISLYHEA
mgnify:FL=1